MAREMFGDDMVLMIDGNGSYSVKEAIRIGKILEEYNYEFYEEPIPWDWYGLLSLDKYSPFASRPWFARRQENGWDHLCKPGAWRRGTTNLR